MRASDRLLVRLMLVCWICGGLPAAASIPIVDGTLTGLLVLTVETADAGAFGLAAGEATRFEARFEIQLDDPPAPGEPLPDGDYGGSYTRFDLTIGNTSWDETMPHTEPIVRIVGGQGSAVSTDLTTTMPAHPDFSAFLGDPPAGVEPSWLAFDEVGGIDNGSLTGTYTMETSTRLPALGGAGAALVIVGLALAPALARRRASRL